MRWEYQYDYLGQLTNAARRWSDGSLVAGQQFGYLFDEVGNRRRTVRDGRAGAQAVNLLNQVTGRENPGFVNILGSAHSAATVTVNHQVAERKGSISARNSM
ncbi:hypothetical protein NXS98_07540 [Fontisphaera persica]|uniref:hypothetical protein n=1 Tax=Fontisphaera persica TaxID=2974023 RepID=UPI0024BF8E85|nr:hypothetical protein [Fontisphaera persica]WCJ60963.1 hypothetical protein NXS98_07540 [Fontisphaera persica]